MYQDANRVWYSVSGSSLRELVHEARKDMTANSVSIPKNLQAYIEDYICSRQTGDRCLYDEKVGDKISQYIHVFAGGVDAAASKIGIKLNLQKKARSCSGCAKRRMKLNGN